MGRFALRVIQKSPGGRVLSGVTLCNYFLLGFLTLNANAI